MPYIPKKTRVEKFDNLIKQLSEKITCPGEFNYIIARVFSLLVADDHGGVNYHNLSRWHAAVADASTEIERRVLAPYEDKANVRNGEVFDEIYRIIGTNRPMK